jgi:hypothetical protein
MTGKGAYRVVISLLLAVLAAVSSPVTSAEAAAEAAIARVHAVDAGPRFQNCRKQQGNDVRLSHAVVLYRHILIEIALCHAEADLIRFTKIRSRIV